ncbi:EAL domain-containing protein [Aquabacter sp. L1I39]|uniref:putative bifunctional diguanylate cyclase/phosphodiesterase n=1 Tax=Aquabacter sp. L1I39 TaxID=2820278 RepID=UPI001ADA633E|nr:EAL domain-containing protein [Aquabacter sp. L1I39]QTL02588.1 EAL domain-containing protein [Aquabacter sp. L1I39]
MSLVLVCLLALVVVVMVDRDRRALRVEQREVRAALHHHAEVMNRTLALMTEEAGPIAGDPREGLHQLEQRLAAPLFHRFSYERTYLVDGAGNVLFAASDGDRVSDSESFATLRATFQRLTAGPATLTEGGREGILVDGNVVGLATMRRIAPPRESGRHVVYLVAVDVLDRDLLDQIESRVGVQDLRLSAAPAVQAQENGIALASLQGPNAVDLLLAWKPVRSDWMSLQHVTPVVALLSSLLLAICVSLLVRARRYSRALAASEVRARALASRDYLTGLYNRGHFIGELTRQVDALKEGDSLALFFIDLDGFKDINDTLGHGVGDDLLRHVAERISECMGSSGLAARFGGDEFVLFLSPDGIRKAHDLAPRLLEAVQVPFDAEGHGLSVGASIGVAFAPAHATQARELMRLADIALYRAKEEGRGIFQVFEPQLEVEVRNRRTVEQELESAIAQDQLLLMFQPLVDVESERIVGFEALVRWQHPVRGLLLPEAFVPVAERTRLMPSLDRWVLREACRLGRDLMGVSIAVNMSAVSLRQTDFAEHILEILREEAFDPGRLEIEITESALFQTTGQTGAQLLRLREAGVRIALDDFGTGHASLIHVRHVPVTKIKIDRSFIANLGVDRDAASIVEYVVRLGRALGIVLTAEGVETREQLRFLRAFGAQQAQGYLFAPPLAIGVARAMLATQQMQPSQMGTQRRLADPPPPDDPSAEGTIPRDDGV